MAKEIEIRCDDVLLLNNLTGSMKNSLRYNSFFGHFLLFDKFLEDNNLHCILTLMAEGIEAYPEWVQYLKLRKHRYTIELHGYSHYYYKGMTEDEAYESLKKAKDLIEKTFEVEVSRWYVPFGRQFFPSWSLDVCKRLGVQFHTRGGVTVHKYYHYWNSADRIRLQELYKHHGKLLKKATGNVALDLRNHRVGD